MNEPAMSGAKELVTAADRGVRLMIAEDNWRDR
jgi:hypothetical protein